MLRATMRRLQVFVVAVESGGFRACSDKLEISQAAVSHHIRHLEDELGYPLFVRRRGAVAGVTQQGSVAYRQAKDIIKDAGRLRTLGGAADVGDDLPRVRVQSDTVLDALLARRITSFLANRRSLSISLSQSVFERMVDSFNRGEADILYFYSCGAVRELHSEFCWAEPLSICARHDHPLMRRGFVDADQLSEYPFVAPPKGAHFRRCVDRVLSDAGLERYPVVMEADNANLAREAVISGLAISAVITRYLDEELSRFGVRAVPLRTGGLSLEVRRAARRELVLDPAIRQLTDHLDLGPQVHASRQPPPEAQGAMAAY